MSAGIDAQHFNSRRRRPSKSSHKPQRWLSSVTIR